MSIFLLPGEEIGLYFKCQIRAKITFECLFCMKSTKQNVSKPSQKLYFLLTTQ